MFSAARIFLRAYPDRTSAVTGVSLAKFWRGWMFFGIKLATVPDTDRYQVKIRLDRCEQRLPGGQLPVLIRLSIAAATVYNAAS